MYGFINKFKCTTKLLLWVSVVLGYLLSLLKWHRVVDGISFRVGDIAYTRYPGISWSREAIELDLNISWNHTLVLQYCTPQFAQLYIEQYPVFSYWKLLFFQVIQPSFSSWLLAPGHLTGCVLRTMTHSLPALFEEPRSVNLTMEDIHCAVENGVQNLVSFSHKYNAVSVWRACVEN